jgi:tRNA-modifying protein YgfZ
MQQDFPISPTHLKTLRAGAVMVRDGPALLQIQGPGALTCLQGLLTQDLAAPGPDTLVYGAFLTPKGMIVADAWVVREESGFLLAIDARARETVVALLGRTLPPRLARVTDLSDSWCGAWMIGASAPDRLARALGCEVPGAGTVLRTQADGTLLAGGTPAAPFSVLTLGPSAAIEQLARAFLSASGHEAGTAELSAARVLAGWPTLGREIDERTLPQEVRFEENGGVSYTKGCYTGQETVARVHFRGHVNRTLRGVVLQDGVAPEDRTLLLGEKPVGDLKSAIVLPDRVIALAMVRREVENGAKVRSGSRDAVVAGLPFGAEVWS